MKTINYQGYLLDSLRDQEEAVGYLNAALEGGDLDVFLLALKNVVKARGGMKFLSEKTRKSRTSLYKTLAKSGNPYLQGTNDILHAIGMHLRVVLDHKYVRSSSHRDR
jgi:probable addiction module antidote protein